MSCSSHLPLSARPCCQGTREPRPWDAASTTPMPATARPQSLAAQPPTPGPGFPVGPSRPRGQSHGCTHSRPLLAPTRVSLRHSRRHPHRVLPDSLTGQAAASRLASRRRTPLPSTVHTCAPTEVPTHTCMHKVQTRTRAPTPPQLCDSLQEDYTTPPLGKPAQGPGPKGCCSCRKWGRVGPLKQSGHPWRLSWPTQAPPCSLVRLAGPGALT